jgi:hypothetical protein
MTERISLSKPSNATPPWPEACSCFGVEPLLLLAVVLEFVGTLAGGASGALPAGPRPGIVLEAPARFIPLAGVELSFCVVGGLL